MIPILLCLQIVPLVVFPASSYSLATQEWWLPLFLSILTIIGLIQVLLRKSVVAWPWYLLSFSQGFNIISRLMMILPHATISGSNGAISANTPYLLITLASLIVSTFELWYTDLPEIRQKLASRAMSKVAV
jgi:hypothetical protein